MVSIFSFIHDDLAELHNTPVRLYQLHSFLEFSGRTIEVEVSTTKKNLNLTRPQKMT
jgi:hypothetical protein